MHAEKRVDSKLASPFLIHNFSPGADRALGTSADARSASKRPRVDQDRILSKRSRLGLPGSVKTPLYTSSIKTVGRDSSSASAGGSCRRLRGTR